MAAADRSCSGAHNLGMLAAALLAASAACSTARVSTQPGAPDQRRDLQVAIARLSAEEPDSPATLNARLDYVEYLTNDATPADCGFRLASAQSELDAVAATRATQVLFPQGWARAIDAEYRIHSARASCVPDAPSRESELRAALSAARRAVALYGETLDYRSMAVMQFNVSVTEELLGEHAAAVDALESALAMDREFGFRDDARDNYAQLQRLRGEPEDASHIAAQLTSFPERSVTLRFAWSPGDQLVSVQSVRKRLVDASLIDTRAQSTLRRTIRARGDAWIVSYEPLTANDDAGVWPTGQSVAGLEDAVFPPALLVYPSIAVRSTGDLYGVVDVDAFAARLTSGVEAAIRAHAPGGAHATSLLERGLQLTQEDFAPEVIEGEVTQSYSLETGMWIGATLQQGVWYESQAPLILPATSNLLVTHHLQFAYTRPVSCTASSPDLSCVELVIKVTPDAEALAALDLAQVHYASESDIRLVIDPSSLQPRLRETRRYWYVAIPGSKEARPEAMMQSESEVWKVLPTPQTAARP